MTEYLYDVAISFLSRDLNLARELFQSLSVGLSVFMYERRKEALLGNDGMEMFGRVFGKESRLAVVLYRDGWGQTPWTAFEEQHIKDRGLQTRMTSFMFIKLDDRPLPNWVPSTHLYGSTVTDTAEELVGAIKLRAREQGAVVRQETATERVLRGKRETDAEKRREERFVSSAAPAEVRQEIGVLFGEIARSIEVIRREDAEIRVEHAPGRDDYAITSPSASTLAAWIQPVANNLRDARLKISRFRGRLELPRSPNLQTQGGNWESAEYFVPRLSKSDAWVWEETHKYDPPNSGVLFFSPSSPEQLTAGDLAERIIADHFQRAFRGGSD